MALTTYDTDVIAAARGRATALADGAVIYARGEPADCAYIVTRGGVRIGNGVPIEVLRPGEVFGEMALLDGGPRCEAAIAVGPTEVQVIERALFEVLIRDDPDFAITVLRLTARRLRAAMAELDRATGRSRPELRVIAGG
jgi:CRP/FNR family cyclic AMP-dependent transcriptional regulator